MKRSLFIAGLLLAALASGCSSPCVKLAQKICDCQSTQTARDTCNSNVSARADQVQFTSQDNDNCNALIDKCACYELDTPQGKANCGLAR
ncbi:MAG: hypothetical protein JST54_31140 [Deltaproteobacteria bacterium]|nr:hypothetical protein [Deltaproteobacteria bacterium]